LVETGILTDSVAQWAEYLPALSEAGWVSVLNWAKQGL